MKSTIPLPSYALSVRHLIDLAALCEEEQRLPEAEDGLDHYNKMFAEKYPFDGDDDE